jgi:hypothetical protein
MKYCIDFDRRFHYIDEVDEIKINYIKQRTDAIEFIQEYPNQTVILSIDMAAAVENNDISKLSTLKEEHPELNFKVEFTNFDNNLIDELKKAKFNFFFNLLINNWDTLLGVLDLGVSDVYIVEHLAFELDKVAEIVHSKGAQIRCFANIAQNAWIKDNQLKSFFIRPEDVSIYEPYVDVIHFMGEMDRMNTYYEIYHNDKKWFGNLNELILDFDMDLDSKFIIPRFAEQRIKCGKKCLKGEKCQICERIVDLSQTLSQAGLIVRIDKNKEDDTSGKGSSIEEGNS